MKQNHFYIPYTGNKRREADKIYDYIKPFLTPETVIIEPFCGSCAMSYYISQKHPKMFKYILNDTDNNIIQLLRIAQNPEAIPPFDEEIKNIHQNMKTKDDFLKEMKNGINSLPSWFIVSKKSKWRYGFCDLNRSKYAKSLKNYPITHFLQTENIEISQKDGEEIIKENLENPNVIFLIDPPYLKTEHKFYGDNRTNIYKYFNDNPITNAKALCLLILENNPMTSFLFNNLIKITYEKKYEITKRKTMHHIICNR